MKNQAALQIIIPLVWLLSLIAASMGLLYQTPEQPYSFTNHPGEIVQIHGQGLYYFDTVNTTAQMQGNDLIILVVGLPLLAVSTWRAFRRSIRGRLLLTGTLGPPGA